MAIRASRASLTALIAGCGLAVAGCGSGGATHSVSLSQLPLVSGAKVVAQARQCDRGSHAFCAIQAVIVGRRFTSSGALVKSEHDHLHSLGWTMSAGDDGDEVAADSPGHKVRVTFATAVNDLIGIDEMWIKRRRAIGLKLSQTMFRRMAAMSIMLEVGPT